MALSLFKKRFPTWLAVSFFLVTALLIIVFNDVLGKDETFLTFALFFFAAMIFYFIRLLIIQIKLVLILKRDKKQTELMHLKSQVNPHFFFNTLNNLYGLVGQDTEKAQRMILKLSDMMRYSIYNGQNDFVPLAEEIEYLNNYIELHKMRYHKTINVQFVTAVEDDEVIVMPLLFIILLENAFKHGVENLRKDAVVSVRLHATINKVNFEIKNNFDPSALSEHRGIGLDNLKRRLDLVYPNKHTLITEISDTQYTAKLNLQL